MSALIEICIVSLTELPVVVPDDERKMEFLVRKSQSSYDEVQEAAGKAGTMLAYFVALRIVYWYNSGGESN